MLECVPARRLDLLLRPLGDDGHHVVKDLRTGDFFQLGEEEAFLFEQLDGVRSAQSVCEAFEARFRQPLPLEDLQEFMDLAREQGLLQPPEHPLPWVAPAAPSPPAAPKPDRDVPPPGHPLQRVAPAGGDRPRPQQSLLRWRQSLFDPDRLFTWLHPRLAFFWTSTFVVLALLAAAATGTVAWTQREELVVTFKQSLGLQTVVLAWVVLLAVTTLHEFAHGLTCKHFGGEVHEVGFLLIFLMPSLYCNVTDAWLFRERWKRLWVTLAGGCSDLVVWSLAVFCWRLTLPDTLLNYLAYVVLAVVGTRILLNLNPLIKLDGYYFLSDLVGAPNLQQRAMAHVMGHLRWLLWGATRPEPQKKGGFLLVYGLLSWIFSLVLLVLIGVSLSQYLGDRWGPVASLSVVILSVFLLGNLFHGFFEGELREMFLARHKRALAWASVAGLCLGYALLGHQDDHAKGGFQLRSVVRTEVRAPVAGFLVSVLVEEGTVVRPGAVVARMGITNLDTRIAQSRAEIRELEARLRLLLAGPRAEEVAAQRKRVERAERWHALARQNLRRGREAYEEEMRQLDRQTAQYRAEADGTRQTRLRAERLRGSGAIAEETSNDLVKRERMAQARLEQSEAQQRARAAVGCREDEAEVVRRGSALAEAREALNLLEAGTRQEEIDAERARLARANEEARHLGDLRDRLVVRCPAGGVVTTPRLADNIGQYLNEGQIICVVEEPSALEAEVLLTDEEMARIEPGQQVELQPRNSPRQSLDATVERIAPRAAPAPAEGAGGTPSPTFRVVVYCRLDTPPEHLRPGTVGHARIHCGRRPVRDVLADKVRRLLRTEFWW